MEIAILKSREQNNVLSLASLLFSSARASGYQHTVRFSPREAKKQKKIKQERYLPHGLTRQKTLQLLAAHTASNDFFAQQMVLTCGGLKVITLLCYKDGALQ